MEKNILSKSTYIKAMQCRKQLYLYKKKYFLRDAMPPERAAIFKRGHQIGHLAQELFPGGFDCTPKSPSQYKKTVLKTAELITEGHTEVIYEAGFQADRTLVLLDVLVKAEDGWEAYEVKSSLRLSETYYKDAALQNYVIKKSGLDLKRFYLVHMNPDYRLEVELDLDKLFIKVDVTEEVNKEMETVAEGIEESVNTTMLDSSPKREIGKHCFTPYDCDFIGHCWSQEPQPGIYNLPMLRLDEKDSIRSSNEGPLSELLAKEDIDRLIKNQISSWQKGKSYIDKEAVKESVLFQKTKRTHIVKPLYYRSAKPHLQGDAPYEKRLFAYGVLTLRTKPNGSMARRMDVNVADCDEDSLKQFEKKFQRIAAEDSPVFFEHYSEEGIIDIFKNGLYVHPNVQDSYDLHSLVKIWNPEWQVNRDCPSDIIAAHKFMEVFNDEQIESENVQLIENYLNEELMHLADLYVHLSGLIE